MMKKILLIITFIISANVNAQSDGFFADKYDYREKNSGEWGEILLLPNTHGLDYNYPADNAPITHGLPIMLVMGIVYLIKKNDG